MGDALGLIERRLCRATRPGNRNGESYRETRVGESYCEAIDAARVGESYREATDAEHEQCFHC